MQLKLDELAASFGVEENVIHRWIRENNLPAQIANLQLRFNRADVVEWATLNHIPIPVKLLTLKSGESLSKEFASSLEIGGVYPNVPGTDKAAVLRNIVTKLPGLSGDDQASLTTLLLTREWMGSTAVGDGIAIPHPSCPVSLTSGQSIAMLCYLEQPLDFQAADKQPVHALFVLLTPSVRRHSLLIAQVASALQDKDFRAAVRRRAPEAEILTHVQRIGRNADLANAEKKVVFASAQD